MAINYELIINGVMTGLGTGVGSGIGAYFALKLNKQVFDKAFTIREKVKKRIEKNSK